jgi:hypothetical protein
MESGCYVLIRTRYPTLRFASPAKNFGLKQLKLQQSLGFIRVPDTDWVEESVYQRGEGLCLKGR